mgnify:CR=1 FL=1
MEFFYAITFTNSLIGKVICPTVTDLFTSNFIIITILSIIIISGFYLYSNVFNKLYNIINDYSSKLTVIKNTIFTDENLNQLNLDLGFLDG